MADTETLHDENCWVACPHDTPPTPKPIETAEWRTDETTGYMKRVRTKTVEEVYSEINARLAKDEYGYVVVPGIDDYFNVMGGAPALWPDGRVVVFPVTGGSEGHYVHVEVHGDDTRTLLMLGKTFLGMDAAWHASKVLAGMLGV